MEILSETDLNLVLVDRDKEKLSPFNKYDIPLHVCDAEVVENVDYLGLNKDDLCLVLMSSNVGSSILVAQNLIDHQVAISNVFVRVINPQHHKILKFLGVTNFIDPDKMIARKIIMDITKKIDINYFDSDNYVFRLNNNKIHDIKIKDLNNLKKHRINILLIFRFSSKTNKEETIYPSGQTMIQKNDQILLLTPKERIDKANSIFRK